ncbi:hypothetical protein [Paenibacillus gansuensis]|uniref:Uncharacterized protein n=1 Tax=Paenibacillus gansuensis TaxID=306542 RepID=A0ABW5P9P0_9BACL
MSFEPRSAKHSRKSTRAQDEQPALPSRRVKHPSNKEKMSNLYYNFLIVLFIGLTVGLILRFK